MKPTRIVINGRFLTQRQSGVQRFARNVVRALGALVQERAGSRGGLGLTVIAPRGRYRERDMWGIPIHTLGCFRGQAWEQLELPRVARGAILLNLGNTGPLLARHQIVTIFDAATFAYPEAYGFAFRTWYRLLLKSLGRTADRVLTVSHFSKSELIQRCGIHADKITVVPPGVEHVLSLQPDYRILDRSELGEKSFVLSVGNVEPKKNYRGLLEAFRTLDGAEYTCVIVGSAIPRVFAGGRLPIAGHVKYLGYVTDAELYALYQSADCFVFPSFYEGFGLPAVEAMRLGCPTIVSSSASLPEVCGDGALYCDPHDPRHIASQIRRVMADPALREALKIRGIAQASQYTWERCARQILGELEHVADSRARP